MRTKAVALLTVLTLVPMIASLYLHPGTSPKSQPVGCPKCQTSCGDPNYLEQYDSTVWVACCIESDGIPPPHCCTTERQIRKLFELQPPHYLAGNCYAYYCPGATPTTVVCSNAGCS